jgi:hypothetical protein
LTEIWECIQEPEKEPEAKLLNVIKLNGITKISSVCRMVKEDKIQTEKDRLAREKAEKLEAAAAEKDESG